MAVLIHAEVHGIAGRARELRELLRAHYRTAEYAGYAQD